MTGKNLFLVLLGIILLLSGLVAILGLVAKTSEHNIPREHICLSSPHHQESYDSIWDRVVRKTGIDDRTAALTRISLEIEPDATLDTMDLQFTAKRTGWRGTCGMVPPGRICLRVDGRTGIPGNIAGL